MGELADRLDNIRVRVQAPGVDLHAELSNRSEIAIEFGESVYEFIDESALERALASLARLLYAGWQRQYLAAVDAVGLNIDPDDRHDLNFQDERDAVQSTGSSSDGRVTLSAVGMDTFSATIQRGTVRELRERDFVARVTEAASALLADHRAQVVELKARYYG